MGEVNPYKETGNHRNTKKTTEEFVEQAKSVWGDRYDFSQVDYQGANIKVKVICPEHGEFWVKPLDLLHGHGCSACAGTRRLNNDIFIQRAKEKHGDDRYDYSLINYKNLSDKIPIICHKKDENGNEHGIFYQSPRNHLQGDGCPKCNRSFKKTTEEFIEQARKVHGDKYDYSKSVYVSNKTPIIIICPKHGEFIQKPLSHLQGQGCQKCYYERSGNLRRKSLGDFIRQANEIHNGKYDYSKVNYVNGKTPVTIICPKHGEFQQTPEKHINRGQGCPYCSESHMERDCAIYFEKNGIAYERQKKFPWLKYKQYLPLDFYLPEFNVAIECQGEQHYRQYDAFTGKRSLEEVTMRDELKNRLCKEHGIEILYLSHSLQIISHSDIYNKNNVFTSIKKMVECVNETKNTLFEAIVKDVITTLHC